MKEELIRLYKEFVEEVGRQRKHYGSTHVAPDAEQRLDLFMNFIQVDKQVYLK